MAYTEGERLYEWSQTKEGDYRLRIFEDGVVIHDETIFASDFNRPWEEGAA